MSFLDDLNTKFNSQSLTGLNSYAPSSSGAVTGTGSGGSFMDLANFGKDTSSSAPFSFSSANSVGGGGAKKVGGTKGMDTLGMFGAASAGISALGSLLQAYNGAKQVKLGRDSFNFQKSAFNQDSANQAKMVNSELEDRQKSRISSTGNNNAGNVYESLDSYLNKNRVTANPL